MLDIALSFLVDNLNAYLLARTGQTIGAATLTRVVDDAGKCVIGTQQLGVTLVNVEEERVLRAQEKDYAFVNGKNVVLPPPLKLNLHMLVAANFTKYDDALRYLSYVLTYFQAHAGFVRSEYPALDSRIEKLTVELLSLTYEQLNQLWTFVGGKQLPSAVYKIRMVCLQDLDLEIHPPIQSIGTEVGVQ